MNAHWAAAVEKVSRRLKLRAPRHDFISLILNYNEGKGLTLGEIKPKLKCLALHCSRERQHCNNCKPLKL